MKQPSARYCFSSHALYRLLLARTPTAYAPCMSERVKACAPGETDHHAPPIPIRMPKHSSRLGGQMLILLAQPCINPGHARHHSHGCIAPFYVRRSRHRLGVVHKVNPATNYTLWENKLIFSLLSDYTLADATVIVTADTRSSGRVCKYVAKT